MRLRQASKIVEANPQMVIQAGDVLGLAGPRELLLKIETMLGPEVDDRELFDVPIQILDVVITNKKFAGKTLLEIRQSEVAQDRPAACSCASLCAAARKCLSTPAPKWIAATWCN